MKITILISLKELKEYWNESVQWYKFDDYTGLICIIL